LTATDEDAERLASLFLEPPSLEGVALGDVRVGEAVAIAGRRMQVGYWAVTVEVDVTEPVPVVTGPPDESSGPVEPPSGGGPAPAGGADQQTTTWYLEVPVVGQADGGLVALTAPAVLPAPPDVETGWRPSFGDANPPAADDPAARTAEGFLEALLAGAGDPDRYVAPGLTVTPADPPPFVDVEVVSLAVDELGEGEFRLLAEVSALTASGARQRFSYELVVVERVDRLEITQFAGAPTRVAGSAAPGP
jgi:hypothetical protein